MKQSMKDLFIELAKPDKKTGISRWVYVSEFVGKYSVLQLGNGNKWGRRSSPLAKIYNVVNDKNGNKIYRVRLNGFNNEKMFSQAIRKDIVEKIKNRKCVMLGIKGTSENTRIEVDHKDGRKNDMRVSDPKTQKLDDFQPLCKAANDIKREICKKCKENDIRWDAKNISGNPYSFYEGDQHYNPQLGCVGCYQYDPVAYRLITTRKLCEEASHFATEKVMNELFPEYKGKWGKK